MRRKCRSAEGVGRELRQDRRGDAKSAGAVAARRLADALSKLCRGKQAVRDKAQSVFRDPLKVTFDQLKNTLQAQPVNLKTLPPELGRWLEDQGRPDAVEALEGRSQRQRQSP